MIDGVHIIDVLTTILKIKTLNLVPRVLCFPCSMLEAFLPCRLCAKRACFYLQHIVDENGMCTTPAYHLVQISMVGTTPRAIIRL